MMIDDKDAPELVLKKAYGDPNLSHPTQKGMIGFSLYEHDSPDTSPTPHWYSVRLHDRSIHCTGDSASQAIAVALHQVAQLARDGSMDPNDPARIGSPPIQHVMNILSDRLAWHIERRRESCDEMVKDPSGDKRAPFDPQGRHNEVISALGTAISALARIKDL